MASKGPRSKLDHETRSKRQKALEAPREPPRPKTHWDHVLEEMIWLSKDFESERKWKLSQAKRVAIRASKSILDHSTRGERRVKEEEHRLRKVALNISKDVKKFWVKIEKLVLYKHQLELEEKKKKALDKQLDFLLGQTERYSTMLAENLVDMSNSVKSEHIRSGTDTPCNSDKERDKSGLTEKTGAPASQMDSMEIDDDYGVLSEDDAEDDEHTVEEDEAQITEVERKEELLALHAEADLPLEELLKTYNNCNVSREASPEICEDVTEPVIIKKEDHIMDSGNKVNGSKHVENPPTSYLLPDQDGHNHFVENNHLSHDSAHKHQGDNPCLGGQLVVMDQQPELHSKGFRTQDKDYMIFGSSDEPDDTDYVLADEDEKDDEATLSEEELLAKNDITDPLDEIKLLQEESKMTVEELLAKYKKVDSAAHQGIHFRDPNFPMDDDAFIQNIPAKLEKVDLSLPGMEKHDKKSDKESENIIADAAAAARLAQPTGNTFSTTKVRTKFPFLLKHPLREYQHIGLDWLVTMYEKRLNGILADEMGLGKTIMTIALLAHLACEKGIWGPHLIVVPTSVMLNWETEFLKWCPAFKILTYFGSAKERKNKRQGWLKPYSFHVCITTYRLVIQDSKVFKRKKWKYLILDEAHLIKNWKSQRWQTLLNFSSKRRILLTGTPLQNDLMELWSLMHFLMPHIFQSHQEFKDWFCNPIAGMVEGQEKVNRDVVDRLHNVLRPFILRRLKRDVEKQLPKKYEHVVYCRLSKRQRNLYEEFITRNETQATLASANYFGMISVIMQLRKVCNHPDLFEGRPIISSFDTPGIDMQLSSAACTALSSDPFSVVDLQGLNFVFTQHDFNMTSWEIDEVATIACPSNLIEDTMLMVPDGGSLCHNKYDRRSCGMNIFEEIQKALCEERFKQLKERAAAIAWWNSLRCQKKPVYGTNLRTLVTIKHPVSDIHMQKNNPSCFMDFSSKVADVVLSPVECLQKMLDLVECFMFAIPASRSPPPACWCSKGGSPVLLQAAYIEKCTEVFSPLLTPIRPAIVRRQVYFPDRRLIQFDCGKLQELAVLLRRLKSEGHRALIFTQMTKMLDILEAFINLYGYTYMRLDGSTLPEQRQTLMQCFNTNPKFFLFILSTRSGGVGINLVGADTVIFYDSDWNPAMDQQAQDRCHRIGQTREVHIYRLISESTIEENILKKANQKRVLDDLVIQSGSYNTEFFKKLDPVELFSGHKGSSSFSGCPNNEIGDLSNADVEAAIKQAEDEADYMALKRVEQEEAVDNQEFTEEVVARLDEDEFINEDDIKPDEKIREEQSGCTSIVNRDNDPILCGNDGNEEKALTLVGVDEDIDMLADVKQMAAAAAAAGQASSSFENQLQPIDRYAMRFLDLWDPIIDKSAIEFQVNVSEEEWELDRIEKFKEDLEAEIDEDHEPFIYERWDADFATMAYRQHVEAVAQRQLLEEQECEIEDTNDADENYETIRNQTTVQNGPKLKKKLKKAKFKSLKKGPLASESVMVHEGQLTPPVSDDEKVLSPMDICTESSPHLDLKKKRKRPEEENMNTKKFSKKLKKASNLSLRGDSNSSVQQLVETRDKSGDGVNDLEVKSANKIKICGKISITVMPLKRVMLVKPERIKKRGNVWSNCFPPPDSWSSLEDAMLCAIVHEYDTHWPLVSDILYSLAGGGFYRGWFRHPVHCCERYRELFMKYVHHTAENSNTEKISSGSGKALLKVTEDQARVMLNVACELADNEYLIQKHFIAILSSVWRANCRFQHFQSLSSRNRFCSSNSFSHVSEKNFGRLTEKMNLTVLRQSSRLVMTALNTACEKHHEELQVGSSQIVADNIVDHVDITLDFQVDQANYETYFPSSVDVSILGPEVPPRAAEDHGQSLLAKAKSFHGVAEHRFRLASEACLEGEGPGWASSAFPSCDVVRFRSGGKSQNLGKHKHVSDSVRPGKSKVARTSEICEESGLATKSSLLSTRPIIDYSDLPIFNLECWKDDNSEIPITDSTLLETPNLELVPHVYEPDFLTGLEDLGSLMDITDVG